MITFLYPLSFPAHSLPSHKLTLFQMTLRSLLDILLSIVRGKPDFPGWLRDAVLRAGLLSVSTVLLLAARVNVMGAQLPVFTR